ncbi:MAG: rRNA maturation RNase YbeY [Planctomycetota bacterium]|jgi:probable rRNA maturation factor
MNEDNDDCDIDINLTKYFPNIDLNDSRIEELVHFVCKHFGRTNERDCSYEINIVIVNDSEIRKLNKSFRNSDSVTDCLSFDISEDNSVSAKSLEIIVNAEKAIRKADELGHSPQSELALYITHGLLHNFGFNDEGQIEAQKMHDTEDEILYELGFGLVYNKQQRKGLE